MFDDRIEELDQAVGKVVAEISAAQERIDAIDKPELREEIEKYYAGVMGSYMKVLNVTDANNDAVTKIAGALWRRVASPRDCCSLTY